VMWSFNTRGEMIIAEREYAPEMDDEDIEVYEHVATQYPDDIQPPVETVQPIEVEQPPVEESTEETVPPSQVQVSAELVKPFLEEPTDSKKFPVNPVILVALVLVAIGHGSCD